MPGDFLVDLFCDKGYKTRVTLGFLGFAFEERRCFFFSQEIVWHIPQIISGDEVPSQKTAGCDEDDGIDKACSFITPGNVSVICRSEFNVSGRCEETLSADAIDIQIVGESKKHRVDKSGNSTDNRIDTGDISSDSQRNYCMVLSEPCHDDHGGSSKKFNSGNGDKVDPPKVR